ncbi:MAG TPA: CAP domain-containing protein, partial [Bacillales bacterium]|nr:CAP domain-containing protein [Bacillales bacterium]
DVLKGIQLDHMVSLKVEGNDYKFQLKDDDVKARPLIRIGNDWAILYFDNFTNRLAGIRYLDGKTLVTLRPYSLTYRGELFQQKNLNHDQWEAVEAGEDQGILDMTNVIRTRFGLNTLKWNDKAATAAFGHSKDMAVHNYFAHTSPTQGTVGERLHKAGIKFWEAGENIAYNYPDGIAAMFGWLNSKGHRENLLHKTYTGLGVGVYEKEYTQDFVKPF